MINYSDNKFYSSVKASLAKLLFGIFSIKISWRKNNLSQQDYLLSKKIIKTGDLVLVGNFKEISGLFIGKYFTHSLLYIGAGECVHAGKDGVRKILFEDIFSKYDTCMILRPNIGKDYNRVVFKAVKFAKKQIGKPYDIFLEADGRGYFCTHLINISFLNAGFDTGILNRVEAKRGLFHIFSRIKRAPRADQFLGANFSKVFVSCDIENNRNIYSIKIFKRQLFRV